VDKQQVVGLRCTAAGNTTQAFDLAIVGRTGEFHDRTGANLIVELVTFEGALMALRSLDLTVTFQPVSSIELSFFVHVRHLTLRVQVEVVQL